MSGRSETLRRWVTIVSLLAVWLGALEHEDLIFQEGEWNWATTAPCAETSGPEEVSLVAHGAVPDRGTEGTFRSEWHRLWLSPTTGVIHPVARRPDRLAETAASARERGTAAAAWEEAGGVELRV